MQEAIQGVFGIFGYIVIPVISGIVTSFIVEGINIITVDKVRGRLILTIVSIGIAFLIVKIFNLYYTNIWEVTIAYLSNITVAVVFYHTAGDWTVKALLKGFKRKMNSYLN